MADISILDPSVKAAPKSYLITGSQEIVLKGVTASFDGTGAGGSFIPAVQVVDPSGFVVGTYTLGVTLAAGASADVSWFPGVTNQSASGSLEIEHNGGNIGSEPALDFVDTGTVTFTVADTPGVKVAVSAAAAGGGGGFFWPAANQASASYDTTTYSDPVSGGGKLDTLVFPAGASGSAAFAMAETGDAHPRVLIPSTMDVTFSGGILLGDGTFNVYTGGTGGIGITPAGAGNVETVVWGRGANVAQTGVDANSTLQGWETSFFLGIEKAPGHTTGVPGQVKHYAGHGAPGTLGGNVGDKYWRQDSGAGTYLYHCSVAGGTGAATWVAIL